MLRERTAGWAIAIVLVISVSLARGQSAGEASVRLNVVPVIQVTGSGNESATARAARIERRLERLADRVAETARPAVVRGPTDDTRVVQSGDAPIVTVTRADAEDHLLTVDELAEEWAYALGVALDQARASRLSPWPRFAIEVRGSVITAATWLAESPTRIIPRVPAASRCCGVLDRRRWHSSPPATDSRRADLLATTSVVRRRVVEAFSDAGVPLPEPDLRRVELQSDRSA